MLLGLALLVLFSRPFVAGDDLPRLEGLVQLVTVDSAELLRIGPRPMRLAVDVTGTFADLGETTRRIVETAPERRHVFDLEALLPGERYAWNIVDPENGAELARGEFRTPPGADSEPVRFVAVGDSGALPAGFALERSSWLPATRLFAPFSAPPGQIAIAEGIAAEHPDVFLHLGDVAYSHDLPAAIGPAFFAPFAPVMRTATVQVVAGNHDYHHYPTARVVDLLGYPSDPVTGMRTSYAFTWGAVRVVVLDTERGRWASDPGRAWLVERLAETEEPWLCVAMHHPVFSCAGTVQEELRTVLWPLFEQYGVALVLCGHHHSYQRFAPVGGVVQVVVGGGGDSLDAITPDSRLASHDDRDFGFLAVDVAGPELTGRFLRSDGTEVDRFDLRLGDLRLEGAPPRRRARVAALLGGK